MTSVPKPLKFLRSHYDGLKKTFEGLQDSSNKKKLADVISVLAITSGKEGARESLKYRLLGDEVSSISSLQIKFCCCLKMPVFAADNSMHD